MKTSLLLSTFCAFSLTTHASIVNFDELIDATQAMIPEKSEPSTRAQQGIAEFLESALIDEAVECVTNAQKVDELRDVIERGQEDLQEHVVAAAHNMAEFYVNSLFENHRNQTIAFMTLLKEVATHENVIVQFITSWCPTCQCIEPMLEQYAQENPSVRIISIDAAKHRIPGISIDLVPTLIFFKNGKQVYTQTGVDMQKIKEQFPDTDAPDYQNNVLMMIETDLRQCIEQYHLS